MGSDGLLGSNAAPRRCSRAVRKRRSSCSSEVQPKLAASANSSLLPFFLFTLELEMVLPDFGDSTESTAFRLNVVYVSAVKRNAQLQPNAQVVCQRLSWSHAFQPRPAARRRVAFLHTDQPKEHLAFTERQKLKLCHQRIFVRNSWTLVDLPTCRPKRSCCSRHSRALVPYCSFRLPERRRAASTCAYSARVALVTVPENLSENDEANAAGALQILATPTMLATWQGASGFGSLTCP